MKKFRLLFFLALLCSALALSVCKKSDSNNDLYGNCEALAEDLSNANSAFSTVQTEETCQDYYDAIDDYFNGCNLIPQYERDVYQQVIDEMDCSIYATD